MSICAEVLGGPCARNDEAVARQAVQVALHLLRRAL